MNKFIANEQ